jgi:hypothetical protein
MVSHSNDTHLRAFISEPKLESIAGGMCEGESPSSSLPHPLFPKEPVGNQTGVLGAVLHACTRTPGELVKMHLHGTSLQRF